MNTKIPNNFILNFAVNFRLCQANVIFVREIVKFDMLNVSETKNMFKCDIACT